MACALVLALAGCIRPTSSAGGGAGEARGTAGANAGTASEPLRAVATVGMVADAVRNVGGERVRVTTLMGPGVDPHLYVPSEGDVRRLNEADVVFHNGLHLEARLGDVLKKLPSRIGSYAPSKSSGASSRVESIASATAYEPTRLGSLLSTSPSRASRWSPLWKMTSASLSRRTSPSLGT